MYSCREDIKPTEKVFILGYIVGLLGTIHLCESCITEISNSKDMDVED